MEIMKINLNLLSKLLVAFCCISIVSCNLQETYNGKWVKADFHMHTTMSDGNNTPEELAENAFQKYDLDVIAISEHGGKWYKVNDDFLRIDDNNNIIYDGKEYDSANVVSLKKFKNQSRTIQLENKSFSEVLKLRKKYPQKMIIQGLEWNIPGHDHGSIGILAETGKSISDFHYMFDRNDIDYFGKPNLVKNCESIHENSLKGLKYLEQNYPQESYFIVNHPSRSLKYTIADLRDFNNASSQIAIGFEGIPGHQKFEGNRGEYTKALSTDPNYDSRTYGGADYFLSELGGVWDALLGEGRRFWVFGNSDYHRKQKDYWPGEYTTNYVWSTGDGYKSVIEGMKSGNIFVVQNNLIEDLKFTATANGELKTMGEVLQVQNGTKVKIIIGFKSYSSKKDENEIELDHIDLICGDVTGLIKPESEQYNNTKNKSTKILRSFKNDEFLQVENEIRYLEFNHEADKSEYLRLRGSSLAINTKNETDEFGNPLCDTLVVNTDAAAKADSWFYSNPIFINTDNK